MINLLIVSYFFPPSNDIAARRFGTMTSYLEKSGLHVSVLTTRSQGSLPLELAEGQVIRIGDNRQKSASVEDLSAEKLPFLIDMIRRPTRQKGYYLWSVDRTITTWYRDIKANIAAIDAQMEKPDLIIGSFGPSASLWVAQFLAKHYRKPWIADIRDLGAPRDDERAWLAQHLDAMIEKRLLASAAALTTVSVTLQEILDRKYRKPVEVVYNGWDQSLNRVIPAGPGNYPSYIYYAGRFYPAQMQAIQLLLEALVEVPALTLVIRSLGPNDLNHHLLIQAAELGLSDRVMLLPPCNHEVVSVEAANSFCNLVVEDMSTELAWTRGTLTGKLFELLVQRSPILAIARPDSEIGGVLQQTDKGLLCSTREGIIQFLNTIEPGGTAYAGESQAIQEFSRERQAAKLGIFIRQYV